MADAFNPVAAGAKRRTLFRLLGIVLVVCVLAYGTYYLLYATNHVTTDNAYVGAEIADITPSTGGTVKEIDAIDTQQVKAGDVLVVLDDTDAKLMLARVEADAAKAQAELSRTLTDHNRRVALAHSGSVSGEELSNADNAYKAAQAAFDAAKADADQARVDLERTVVRAPIDGVVAKRQVELGQRVSAGTPLLSIVPTDKMHVDANFKEVQLRHVKIGQPVRLTADLYGDSVTYHGRVAGIAGGTGSAFAIIPSQNASGNWIKVVQRLPVRIALDGNELKQHPLQVGLSMQVDIDVSK